MTSTGETQDGNSIEVDKGASVTYSVSKEGYETKSSVVSDINEDKTISVVLDEITGEVDVDASTSTSELYRDAETGNVYTDQVGETPFTASVYGETDPVQVKALDTNTITIGSNTFVKLTAGSYDVIDNQGNQLVWDNVNGNLCYIVDGVAETSNMGITDIE